MQYHRMRKKDTLERLSADYGVPICMIVRANGGQLRFQPGDLVAISSRSKISRRYFPV